MDLPAPPPQDAGAPDRRARRRLVVRSVLRSVATVTLLFALYALAPIEGPQTPAGTVVRLVLVLVIVAVLLAVQVGAIRSANHPDVRAVEALVTAVTVFLVLFALLYLGIAQADAASFSQPLGRVSALYFTVTILATVGFGDISAQTDGARLLVTVQMLLGLGLVAVVVRVFSAAARAGAARRSDAQRAARN